MRSLLVLVAKENLGMRTVGNHNGDGLMMDSTSPPPCEHKKSKRKKVEKKGR